MSSYSPGPWISDGPPDNIHILEDKPPYNRVCFLTSNGPTEANARLIAAAPDLLAALKAASGYLLNAKIDLETGAPKKTAIRTIDGGLKFVRAAIVKAEGESQP